MNNDNKFQAFTDSDLRLIANGLRHYLTNLQKRAKVSNYDIHDDLQLEMNRIINLGYRIDPTMNWKRCIVCGDSAGYTDGDVYFCSPCWSKK